MVKSSDTNRLMRFRRSIPQIRFRQGYIAINGASLTCPGEPRRRRFEVAHPETRRMTVFEDKQVGDFVNIEIERSTQVMVDTVRTVQESLGKLQPEAVKRKGLDPGRLHQPQGKLK